MRRRLALATSSWASEFAGAKLRGAALLMLAWRRYLLARSEVGWEAGSCASGCALEILEGRLCRAIILEVEDEEEVSPGAMEPRRRCSAAAAALMAF